MHTQSPVQGVHWLQAGLGGRMVGAGRQLGEQCVVFCGVLPVHHLCPRLLLWILLPPWCVLQLGCHSKHRCCSSCSPCLLPAGKSLGELCSIAVLIVEALILYCWPVAVLLAHPETN